MQCMQAPTGNMHGECGSMQHRERHVYSMRRPADPQGQPAQTGQKAQGPIASQFDQTWLHIGLRSKDCTLA